MGDIVIIGAGFAGLEAARVLSKNRARLLGRRVIVIDAKKTFDFLPILPDVTGGRIRQESAVMELADHLERIHVNFEAGEVVRVDTDTREVFLKSGGILTFEFLIVACGSVTNFYGMDDIQRRSLKLDSAQDAVAIQNVIATYPGKKILVIGGGYTGVEIASNLALLFRHKRVKKYSISIVEKGEDILGSLPQWMKDYCRVNLCGLHVNIHLECSLKEATDQRVKLSNGIEFEDYLLVWAAGVVTPAFVRELKFEKDRQGRLIVDEHMRFGEGCFAVGDAAAFKHKGAALRMSVQFSIVEAGVAAKNVLRLIRGEKSLARYRPCDLGLLVPMANKKACGKVLFIKVSGFAAWVLHYVMCIYRSLSFRNRLGIFCDAFLKIGG